MIIGVLELDLSIPGCTSLKQKRMALRSLKSKVRQSFNVSIAEVDEHDAWQASSIAVVVVSTDQKAANRLLSRVADHVERVHLDLVVDDVRMEFL